MSQTNARVRRSIALCAIAMLVAALVPVAPVYGNGLLGTIYVDAVHGSDSTGTGAIGAPFKTITSALTHAGSGSVIWVYPGTYEPPAEAFPILLQPGVSLRSLSGPEQTVLDANGEDRVLDINNGIADTEIYGFTITGGVSSIEGGGIRVWRDDPAADESGWPRIENCIIAGNTCVEAGGGVWVGSDNGSRPASPVIVNCLIEGNSATQPADGYGGGVYGHYIGGEVEIYDSVVRDNYASYGGGGVRLEGNGVAVGCEIGSNEAGSEGGGLLVSSGAYIADCWIHDNSCGWLGGGINLNGYGGTFWVERCRIEANEVLGGGGGIAVRGAALAELTNLVIASNVADNGGAIYVQDIPAIVVEVALAGSTVVGNIASGFDGIDVESDEHVTITDSIIGHEPVVPGDNSTCEDVLGSYTMSYSSPRDTDLTGTGVVYGYPAFMDPDNGDYELMLGSPCIDTGDPASALIDDVLDRPRPEDANGDNVPRVDMGAYERPKPLVSRIAGTNRYETAGIMAQWREWPGTTAVLACGEMFPDALSGSGLAGAYGGPLLLTAKSSCPGFVFDALQDAGASDVVIVGGTPSVSENVANQLKAQGYGVRRIAGANRYETAALIAREIAKVLGPDFVPKTFLARGDDFADALSSAPFAYSGARPVLLTRTTSLAGETAAAITALHISDVLVVGDARAVSQSVQNAVDALPGVACTRVAGVNRYATSAALAAWGVSNGYATWNQVGIATGTKFPDGLAGGALCGVRSGVLLLTRPTSLPSETYNALHANRSRVVYTEIYGGPTTVSEGVKTAVKSALGW